MAIGRTLLAFALFTAVAGPLPVRAAGAAGAAKIHPSVARVMAAESDGASFGSGTLVAVGDHYGLVVTNWHVVRDSNGFLVVSFPDGFRSTAMVLRVDRDWDLAALAIRKPNAQPVALAREAPRPGDPLIIAGYGKGNFRMAVGRCTQYLSPGGSKPYEVVELDTSARQGDSGGPIFNARGELAGVLFGAGWGETVGSYCGRVREFLYPAWEAMQKLPASAYGESAPISVAQSPLNVPNGAVQSPWPANNNTAQYPATGPAYAAASPATASNRVAQSPATMYPVDSPPAASSWQDPRERTAADPRLRGVNPGVAAASTVAVAPNPSASTAAHPSRLAGGAGMPGGAGAAASLQSPSPNDPNALVPRQDAGMIKMALLITGAVLLVFGGMRVLAKAA